MGTSPRKSSQAYNAAQQLPPELERAVKMAHRSPTYAVALADGRTLRFRREAIAIKRDGTEDVKKLAKGLGEVRWWLRCGPRETTAASLGDGLIRVLGVNTVADPERDFDEWWEDIRLVVSSALALAESVAPNEQQAVAA